MPLLNDPGHKDLIHSMTTKLPKILGIGTEREPKAIILITAHWNTKVPTVSSGEKPGLLYDYGGFSRESYEIRYEAPGSPEVAREVEGLLRGKGFRVEMDDKRGNIYFLFLIHF
jgi:aromatic ring-opening dioxygenase catalytic subunit (LigB family)